MDQAYESTGGGLAPGATGVSLSPRIAVLDLEPGSKLLGLGPESAGVVLEPGS